MNRSLANINLIVLWSGRRRDCIGSLRYFGNTMLSKNRYFLENYAAIAARALQHHHANSEQSCCVIL